MAGASQTATADRGGTMSQNDRPDTATEAFLADRDLLFTVANETLGSAADAEDVLQETWLRWAGVDLGTVRDQRAYLVRITTRQALTRLRTRSRRSSGRPKRAICNACSVRHPCLEYALRIREPHGIWGGLNETERKQLLADRGY